MRYFRLGKADLLNGVERKLGLKTTAQKWGAFVVLLGVCVMGYLLLVKPVIGLEDNGDFLRVTATVGLTDLHSDKSYQDKHIGFAHILYAYGDIRPGGYVSTQFIPVLVAKAVGWVLPGPHFDIRVLGVIYASGLLTSFYLVVRYFGMRTWWANAIMVFLLLFVFVDVGYVAYFNSFYGEPMTYVSLMLMIAIVLKLSRAEETNYRWAILFMVVAILTTGSKTQAAPVAVACLLIAFRLFRLGDSVRIFDVDQWKQTIKRWTIALLAFSFIFYLASPSLIDRINQYQAVFYGILKDSPNPEQDLRSMGFNPEWAVNAGTDFFTPYAPIPQQDPRFAEFYKKVGFSKIIGFYLTHPTRFWSKLEAAADQAWTIRPYYLGNYEEAEGKPSGAISSTFSTWSDWKNHYHPDGFVWILLLYGCYGGGLAWEYRRARKSSELLVPDIFAVVAMIGAISFVVAFIGSGEADFAKHLFLFTVCLDVMLISGVLWLLRRFARG